MKQFRWILPAAGLIAAVAIAVPTFAASGKEAKVRRLLDLTGAGNMGKQAVDAMLDNFAHNKQLPKGFIPKFKARAKPDDLVNLVVPIYMKHLDDRALDGAIRFFSSPAGQAFVEAQPKMVRESMTVGQQWGMKLAKQTMAELEAEKSKTAKPE